MGFLSNFLDDVLGFDPNGHGSSGLWGSIGGITGSIAPFLPPPFNAIAGGVSAFSGLGSALSGGVNNGFGISGGGGDLEALIQGYSDAYNEARTANLERYQEIIGNLKGQRKNARLENRANLDYLRGQRKEAKQQNAERFNNLGARVTQDLVSRGLTNSTVAPSMQFALEGERRRAATDIDNTYNQQLLGQRTYGQSRIDAINNNLLRFKEARTDAYPDLAPLTALAQQYGQAQGNDRARLASQINGFLSGLGGPQGGGYPGMTIFNPYPSGQQQQSGGGLGSILSGIGALGGLFGGGGGGASTKSFSWLK